MLAAEASALIPHRCSGWVGGWGPRHSWQSCRRHSQPLASSDTTDPLPALPPPPPPHHHHHTHTTTTTTHSLPVAPSPQGPRTHAQRVASMLHFMWQQAQGLPTGPHAAFKRHLVDAATLRLRVGGAGSAPSGCAT